MSGNHGSEGAFSHAVFSHAVYELNHLVLKDLKIDDAGIGKINMKTWKN